MFSFRGMLFLGFGEQLPELLELFLVVCESYSNLLICDLEIEMFGIIKKVKKLRKF